MNNKSVDYDLRVNYYALAASILSDKTVEQSLQYFHLRGKQVTHKPKSNEMRNLICVLIFCCGMTKTEVCEMLGISHSVVNEALLISHAPQINWIARHKRLQKYNKERE